MFSNIDTFLDPFLVPIFEIMIGRDTITIDDEGIFLGIFNRAKNYLNIKNLRWIKDYKDTYTLKNA